MKIRSDFSIVNKDKIILVCVFGFLSLACLGNWIATSFGNFDENMAAIFNNAMDIPFFRGWSGYTIMDGYLTVMAYIIPAGLLIVESALLFIKKYQPNWWISQHISWYKYFIILVGVIFEIAIIYSFYYWNWQDQGFGNGYDVEFIIGKEYTIPCYVVSMVLANAVFWTLVWWFHCKLAKRKDFLDLKVWRPIATSLMYMAAGYIVVQYTKEGTGRPYWYNIHFADGLNYDGVHNIDTNVGGYHITGILQRFIDYYGTGSDSPFAHYMNGTSQRGWFGDPGNKLMATPNEWIHGVELRNWKWWMRGGNGIPLSGGAFPSGHMIATAVIALSPTYIFVAKSNSRKYNIIKWCCYALAGIYLLDMIFALQISSSHWWSDSMFSLGFGWAFYGIGWGISNGFCAACNKIFHTKNY